MKLKKFYFVFQYIFFYQNIYIWIYRFLQWYNFFFVFHNNSYSNIIFCLLIHTHTQTHRRSQQHSSQFVILCSFFDLCLPHILWVCTLVLHLYIFNFTNNNRKGKPIFFSFFFCQLKQHHYNFIFILLHTNLERRKNNISFFRISTACDYKKINIFTKGQWKLCHLIFNKGNSCYYFIILNCRCSCIRIWNCT